MGYLRQGSLSLLVTCALYAAACGSSDDKKKVAGTDAAAGQGGQAVETLGGAPSQPAAGKAPVQSAGAGGEGVAGEGVAGESSPAAGAAGAGAGPGGPGDACRADDDCSLGLRCAYGSCVPSVACDTADDCSNDSYCDADGYCVPWGLPKNVVANAECQRDPVLGPFDVELQCSFTTPPETALPSSNQVMTTPSVADLDLDLDPKTVAPSIVFATYATQTWPALLVGNLRIIDGRTCNHQQTLVDAADQVVSTAQPALADLDGDGRLEIVMPRAPSYGGLIAFSQDKQGIYHQQWLSAVCDGQGGRTLDALNQGGQYMAGVSIHDLDDDGVPEILFGATVYDAKGCRLDGAYGNVDYFSGHIPVAADLDSDGTVELATGDLLLEWSGAKFQPKASFAGSHARGFTAVADFGDFGEGPNVADIVVITNGTARIENVKGDVVFGPIAAPGLNRGGPPTIADFDGDGAPEFAAAGASAYIVFDPECDVAQLPADCQARGIRWSKASQDITSNVTGSSVFDFEGDGAAEAVYADECFLRVYDGDTGNVKWSTARASGTAFEYPIVADVDADFHSELVVGSDEWPSGCSGVDPLFPSASFAMSHGIFVYASANDDWAGSRQLWNQHAYSVTNVGDDGRVPATSDWAANWKEPGLNNFRQNVQGGVPPLAAVDLTVSCQVSEACTDAGVAIDCQVCNRGAQGVDAGLDVSFETAQLAKPFCSELTQAPLLPGACTAISCNWADPPRSKPTDVHVFVDTLGSASECFEQNNEALLPGFSCP